MCECEIFSQLELDSPPQKFVYIPSSIEEQKTCDKRSPVANLLKISTLFLCLF